MKYLIFLFLAMALWSANLSESSDNTLVVEATYYDTNDSCLLIHLHGKIIGTQNDFLGSDIVEFLFYDDGKVIAKKNFDIKNGVAQNIDEKIFYRGKLSGKSPGIAVESAELGIYIDPLIPSIKHESCKKLFISHAFKTEKRAICSELEEIGIKCD